MPRKTPQKTQRRPRSYKARRKYRKRTKKPLITYTPVKEGQEIEVLIDDIGSRGDGISRIGSYLIFIPQTKIGERLKVKITKVTKNFAIAEKQPKKE